MNISEKQTSSQCKSIYNCVCNTVKSSPNSTAIISISKNGKSEQISWQGLLSSVNFMSRFLLKYDLKPQAKVVIALPNKISTVITTLAVWHLGCCVFFLSQELTSNERNCLLNQIKPDLVLGPWLHLPYPMGHIPKELEDYSFEEATPLPDIVSAPSRATATGGSTGVPKIIVEEAALLYDETDFKQWEMITGQVAGYSQLVCGSLHHALFNNSFYISLSMGNCNILMEKFNENIALEAIETYHINSLVLVPTMMSRMSKAQKQKKTDLSSIQCLHHAAASCPIWLKKEWIDLIGAKKVHEFYSMSEKVGLTYIRGDEWIKHEGSVGRPLVGKMEIRDDDYNLLPAGASGNVYFVADQPHITHYLTAEGDDSVNDKLKSTTISMGDLGYLDKDDFLYLVDRRSDMIISGGKNIYAAEVENVLKEYSKIEDIVVIGLPDPIWGRKVHALIQPACDSKDFDLYRFTNFGFQKMCNYKLPKTIELVESLPRDNNGKIRRKALVEERVAAKDAETLYHYLNVPNGHQLISWKNRKRKKGTNGSQITVS